MRTPKHRTTKRIPLWEHIASWFVLTMVGPSFA